jgi:hypothetical protein
MTKPPVTARRVGFSLPLKAGDGRLKPTLQGVTGDGS